MVHRSNDPSVSAERPHASRANPERRKIANPEVLQEQTTADILRQTVVTTILLASIFLLDWLTGYDVNVGPLYLLLVFYTSWRGGFYGGLFGVLGATVAWIAADTLSGHHYRQPWIRYENIFVRVLTQVTIAYAVSLYRRTLEIHRKRVRMLEKLVSVCNSCGRVALADGNWRYPKEFLSEHRDKYQTCPVCAESKHPHGTPNTPRNQVS